MKKRIILTVCSGNIHRSVIAQLCLNRELANIGREKEFEVLSRGVQGVLGTISPKYPNLLSYDMEFSYTQPCLKEIGISIPLNQKATPIDAEIINVSSVILAMDRAVLSKILTLASPEQTAKFRLFMEIADKEEDLPDCCGINNASLHRKVVMLIDQVAKSGINTLIRWVCDNH